MTTKVVGYWRAVAGAMITVAAVWMLGWLVSRNTAEPGQAVEQLWQFVATPRQTVHLTFDQPMEVAVGDPIFVYRNGHSVRVGEIARLPIDGAHDRWPVVASEAYAVFYASAPPLSAGDYCTLHHTPDSLAWAVRMMLPAETRDHIQALIADAIQQHQPHILELLAPVVEQSLRQAWLVAEADFHSAMDARQDQIDRLLERYEQEVLRSRVFPVLQEELWPIVQRRAAPTVERIGQRIWARVSYWRFGTSLARDVIPFTQGTATRREFERFVEVEAAPIIEAHADELLVVLQQVIEDVFNNRRIRGVVTDSVQDIVEDAEFQHLLADILHDVIIDNPRFHEALTEPWQSDSAQEALATINRWLEPTFHQIGVKLFGSPETAITPEFARVLRERILRKDMRWLVVHPTDDPAGPVPRQLPVYAGATDTENPFHIPAARR